METAGRPRGGGGGGGVALIKRAKSMSPVPSAVRFDGSPEAPRL